MTGSEPLSHAASEVRRHDRERFACVLFAPPGEREDLLALYAFNLELARVREMIREPMAGMIRLQWWRDTIGGMFEGRSVPPAHPVAAPLAEAVARRRLALEPFERLIEARRRDLDDEPPADMAAMAAYAEATSVPLARIGAAILGLGEGATAAAERVAVAWSLVGLLRALPHHASQGRVMLPHDRLKRAGVGLGEVLAGKSPPGLAGVAAEVAALAHGLLDQARSHRDDATRAALPLLLPAAIAEGHLRRLRRTGYDVHDPLLSVPRPRVARLAWTYLFPTRF